MAILALPARLGEFVRPALIRKRGEVSASAALGTIAVERVVDGLMISLFVFVTFFLHRDSEFARPWMMKTAWAALAIFAAALVFLAFALKWPERTVRFSVGMTMARRFSPRFADLLEEKLLSMISGFLVLKDWRNLAQFVFWSALYWGANGVSLWVLAIAFDLQLPLVGAFATMGIIAVGIILPNSPGLVGQYQWLCVLGLSLYMPEVAAKADGLAFAIVLHGLQVIWYIGIGALALASPYVSFREAFRRHSIIEEDEVDAGAGESEEDPDEARRDDHGPGSSAPAE
jgi:uncharacterized protein (TIRG00374 family)